MGAAVGLRWLAAGAILAVCREMEEATIELVSTVTLLQTMAFMDGVVVPRRVLE